MALVITLLGQIRSLVQLNRHILLILRLLRIRLILLGPAILHIQPVRPASGGTRLSADVNQLPLPIRRHQEVHIHRILLIQVIVAIMSVAMKKHPPVVRLTVVGELLTHHIRQQRHQPIPRRHLAHLTSIGMGVLV